MVMHSVPPAPVVVPYGADCLENLSSDVVCLLARNDPPPPSFFQGRAVFIFLLALF